MKNKVILFALALGSGLLIHNFLKKAGWDKVFDFDLEEDLDVQEE